MTTCRSGGPGAGEAAGCGTTWAGEAEGCSFSRFYFLALQSFRVWFSTGLSSHLLCLPVWGTSSSFKRHRNIGQFSSVYPQLPSWRAGDGADTGHSDELLPWQLGPLNWGEETAVLTFWPNTSV